MWVFPFIQLALVPAEARDANQTVRKPSSANPIDAIFELESKLSRIIIPVRSDLSPEFIASNNRIVMVELFFTGTYKYVTLSFLPPKELPVP